MNKYSGNNQVFIRSVGNHGELGGLSRKSHEMGDVLAASGKDFVFYETVGVGQGEHDIFNTADICLVILVPESGDEIQLMKAGLIEIADIFVINKSDRDGANRLASSLKNILHSFRLNDKIEPPVLNTIATQSDGITQLFIQIQKHLRSMSDSQILDQRRLARYRNRVLELVRDKLEQSFWNNEKLKVLDQTTNKIEKINEAPNVIASGLIENA